jgi:hypothetical protein
MQYTTTLLHYYCEQEGLYIRCLSVCERDLCMYVLDYSTQILIHRANALSPPHICVYVCYAVRRTSSIHHTKAKCTAHIPLS